MHLDIWHLTPTPHFCHSILFRRQKLHLQFEKFFCFCIIQNARCNRLSWIRRRMSISKEILAFPDLKIKDRKTKEEFHKFLGKSHQHLLSAFESCFWKAGHYYLCVCDCEWLLSWNRKSENDIRRRTEYSSVRSHLQVKKIVFYHVFDGL